MVNHVRRIRKEAGLTIKQVSERSGICVNQISRIERGESDPTMSTMCKLAWALRRDVDDLFDC